MMSQARVNAALERLLKIEWAYIEGRDKSQLKLMTQYLGRAALWTDRLKSDGSWPFYDIGDYLAPDIHVPEEFSQRLKNYSDYLVSQGRYRNSRPKLVCEWYLRWEAIRETGRASKYELPDPYEPLVLMFERGGSFTTEHGFIELGACSIRPDHWKSIARNYSPIELTTEYLDQLDQSS